MAEDEEVLSNVEIIPGENESYSDDALYNINSWGADLSFRDLVERYKLNDIIKPEMQRNYVWDKAEASRFIDSILLGLPVPSIFLAKPKIDKEELLIVDGYQRIMTVHDFIEGIFQKDKKNFTLTNSDKINKRWRGKSFKQLTKDEQKKINYTTIHSIIFVQITPKNDTSFYQIFERINTSGRTLQPQEIRNCIYRGKFNKLLIELNQYPKWRELFGTEVVDSRMRDLEFILRFLAISSEAWSEDDDGLISLKKFLNEYMGSEEAETDKFIEKERTRFINTIDFVYENIGLNAFYNISPKTNEYTNKFNPTIFDSIMSATEIALADDLVIDDLEERKENLIQDEEYQELIRFRTTNKDRIAKRISKALEYLYDLNYE
jgi:uncharacterized protein with ParB-like and HNH nuclease domain